MAFTDSLTVRGRCFLAAGVALIVCGIALGFRDITRLGVLVAGLPILVGLTTGRHRLQIEAEREVNPVRVHIDESCDVHLTLRNAGPLRTPILMAEEQLDYALGDRPRFVVPRMSPGERHRLPYRVRSNVRGRHHLGPLGLRVKDPFDLTIRLAAVAGAGELIVLPRVLPLQQGEAVGGVGNEGTIPHMVALHGEDDVSVREYRDGDDLRRIHWPATAKTGDLMVRQEDRPAKRRAVILLDDRKNTSAGERTAGSFEWAVTAAASLVNLFINSGMATHLIHAGVSTTSTTGDQLALDDALESLAIAELGDREIYDESVSVATEIASIGALTAAVVGPLTDADASRLSRIRVPGSTGVALVLDLGHGHDDTGERADANTTAAMLRLHGWSAVVVPNGTSVQQAWEHAVIGLVGSRR